MLVTNRDVRVDRSDLDGAGRDEAVLADLDATRERPKLPRTVVMRMCLTSNPTLECAGSTVQVPVGMAVVIVLIR